MPPRTNQYKPLPPLETIAPWILTYWKMQKSDVEVLRILRENHIDLEQYGLGMTSYKAIRKRMGLLSTRQQKQTIESIREIMVDLREQYPLAGARDMVNHIFFKTGMKVPRELVVVYFRIWEPELVHQRKAGRLKRRRFWAAGVNDILAVDQHDKWLRFGLALHNGGDPFSGELDWIQVWWTNKNPKLITSYYLDDVEEKGGYIPLVTQSDPGSENYGIANAHTTLRHWHDPNLVGTIQHRWMRQKKNVKPEITWSQLRRRFTPGFEDLLDFGVINGLYDISLPLHVFVFCWIFIPYLQTELNAWKDLVNNTKKRADCNKILPHGAPNDIHFFPERYGCLDFKIKVEQEAIDYVRQKFAPRDDPVFQLVPKPFAQYAKTLYESMGSPIVNWKNIWDIYSELLHRFEHLDEAVDFLEECEVYLQAMEAQIDEDNAVPPYGQELEGGIEHCDLDGNYYLGGVNNGRGLDASHEAMLDRIDERDDDFEIDEVDFTDDEDTEDDW